MHEAAAQNPKSLLAVLDDQLYGLLDAQSVRLSHAAGSLSAEDRQIAEILIEGISSLRRDLVCGKQSTQAVKVRSLPEVADRIRATVPLQVARFSARESMALECMNRSSRQVWRSARIERWSSTAKSPESTRR
jgi:hypothetical protein